MKNTVTLERIDHNRKRWLSRLGSRLVRIYSGQWGAYWRPDRSGYTGFAESGVYTFADAFDASGHCGPEKRIIYEFLPKDTLINPTQESRGKAVLLLRPTT